MGPFPLSRSASPVTILHHLLSQPPPSVEHSREVILEYVLSREAKLRDKKPGRGGKGTLGREGFEDVARKLAEIEDGLKLPGIDAMQLSTNRQTGLALILSLRMSLSYFTSVELGFQLLKLHTPDAERVITQHIRKRVEGEGRYGVGQELEQLEDMVRSDQTLLTLDGTPSSTSTRFPLGQSADDPTGTADLQDRPPRSVQVWLHQAHHQLCKGR